MLVYWAVIFLVIVALECCTFRPPRWLESGWGFLAVAVATLGLGYLFCAAMAGGIGTDVIVRGAYPVGFNNYYGLLGVPIAASDADIAFVCEAEHYVDPSTYIDARCFDLHMEWFETHKDLACKALAKYPRLEYDNFHLYESPAVAFTACDAKRRVRSIPAPPPPPPTRGEDGDMGGSVLKTGHTLAGGVVLVLGVLKPLIVNPLTQFLPHWHYVMAAALCWVFYQNLLAPPALWLLWPTVVFVWTRDLLAWRTQHVWGRALHRVAAQLDAHRRNRNAVGMASAKARMFAIMSKTRGLYTRLTTFSAAYNAGRQLHISDAPHITWASLLRKYASYIWAVVFPAVRNFVCASAAVVLGLWVLEIILLQLLRQLTGA